MVGRAAGQEQGESESLTCAQNHQIVCLFLFFLSFCLGSVSVFGEEDRRGKGDDQREQQIS